jgi:hypothetical protein
MQVCDSCMQPGDIRTLTITAEDRPMTSPSRPELCEVCGPALLAMDWSTLAQRKPAPVAPTRVRGTRKAAAPKPPAGEDSAPASVSAAPETPKPRARRMTAKRRVLQAAWQSAGDAGRDEEDD